MMYVDPDGEFFTWSFGRKGFSIGLNFGIFGFGINVSWSDGGSVGVYGELGPRVGGTGFGSGATISQSFDFSFRSGSWSTTSGVGAYASYGPFNAGVNGSYSHDMATGQGSYGWGVSGGTNLFGNDERGLGLNVGYGSSGWTYGGGGYYNPNAWDNNPPYEPDAWNIEEVQYINNCYTYALDENGLDAVFIDEIRGLSRSIHGENPGYTGSEYLRSQEEITLNRVMEAAISDGRVKKPNFWNNLGFGKDGYYSVYLVTKDGTDYHWYRQDKGGRWSHKSGELPVINTDASGRVIRNPARANHNYKHVHYNSGGILLWIKR